MAVYLRVVSYLWMIPIAHTDAKFVLPASPTSQAFTEMCLVFQITCLLTLSLAITGTTDLVSGCVAEILFT
ncbi:uncharacterized protein EDB91DRAFT_209868 [Suillus paluster]|uniref:uncharacterized protein n=1 Tax=Suillus paluster TaxID=48578 RepID=UPI001B87CA09|nr:uncharacterized protein EDB91DRAFT_209868 [Suillus paluster]KAG1744066.1 hypothetical protein EDB91DRAFT_209868 [Suillus paluster]